MDKPYETIYTIKIPPGLYEINGEHKKLEHYVYVRTDTLTAPPVADGEVREAVDQIKEWISQDRTRTWLPSIEALETLIRAATAKKDCDLPETLPCDVTIGVANFMRGTPTRLVTQKIKWWQDMKYKGEVAPKNRCSPEKSCDALVKALEKLLKTCVVAEQVPEQGTIKMAWEALAAYRKTEGGE